MSAAWVTLPEWAEEIGVGRVWAWKLLARIAADRKRFKPTGWEVKSGTPRPALGKAGRPRKIKS